jgi:hypothetical protein
MNKWNRLPVEKPTGRMPSRGSDRAAISKPKHMPLAEYHVPGGLPWNNIFTIPTVATIPPVKYI